MNKVCIDKIFENLNEKHASAGIIIASNSKENPNYFYHWVRDAAIVMKSLVKYYIQNKADNDKIFKQIVNYIEIETHHQKLDTLTGLGEPKFNTNINESLFNDLWGRPQNDGPALRGLTMILIYKNIDSKILKENIKSLIKKDIEYIIPNIYNNCFDLWEEINGYHLYTRLVQYKFIKEYNNLFNISNNKMYNNYLDILNKFKTLIKTHNIKYTSFSETGDNIREYDTSLLLAMNHIDYDDDIINIYDDEFKNHLINIITFYKDTYNINKNNNFLFLGRYKNDKYYDGNPWIICTTGLYQILLLYSKKNIKIIDEQEKMILNYISYVIKHSDLSEQIDKNTGEFIGAKKLTWNYAELYNLWDLL